MLFVTNIGFDYDNAPDNDEDIREMKAASAAFKKMLNLYEK